MCCALAGPYSHIRTIVTIFDLQLAILQHSGCLILPLAQTRPRSTPPSKRGDLNLKGTEFQFNVLLDLRMELEFEYCHCSFAYNIMYKECRLLFRLFYTCSMHRDRSASVDASWPTSSRQIKIRPGIIIKSSRPICIASPHSMQTSAPRIYYVCYIGAPRPFLASSYHTNRLKRQRFCSVRLRRFRSVI